MEDNAVFSEPVGRFKPLFQAKLSFRHALPHFQVRRDAEPDEEKDAEEESPAQNVPGYRPRDRDWRQPVCNGPRHETL